MIMQPTLLNGISNDSLGLGGAKIFPDTETTDFFFLQPEPLSRREARRQRHEARREVLGGGGILTWVASIILAGICVLGGAVLSGRELRNTHFRAAIGTPNEEKIRATLVGSIPSPKDLTISILFYRTK